MKYDLQQHGYGWRIRLADHLVHRHLVWDYRENLQHFRFGGVYQFGVWNGFSLQVLSSMFNMINSQYQNLIGDSAVQYYGFDVFSGMPVEEVEPDKQIDLPGWYNIMEHFEVDNLQDAMQLLELDIRHNMGFDAKLTFTQGLVQDTLTDELAPSLPIASYVDMDMDIYSPTRVALDYLFKHKKIVKGTIIGYDDWVQVQSCKTFEAGESRAHKEIMDKYGATCIQLLETPDRGQAAFIVTDPGYDK